MPEVSARLPLPLLLMVPPLVPHRLLEVQLLPLPLMVPPLVPRRLLEVLLLPLPLMVLLVVLRQVSAGLLVHLSVAQRLEKRSLDLRRRPPLS